MIEKKDAKVSDTAAKNIEGDSQLAFPFYGSDTIKKVSNIDLYVWCLGCSGWVFPDSCAFCSTLMT